MFFKSRKDIHLHICSIVLGAVISALVPLEVFAESTQIADNVDASVQSSTIPSTISSTIETTVHYMPWEFSTYDEPNFSTKRANNFFPQNVSVIEKREDGWYLISTYNGSFWVYAHSPIRHLEKVAYLYNQKGDKTSIGKIDPPQTVKVHEEDGDWLLIETWLGLKWIYLSGITEQYIEKPVYMYNQKGDKRSIEKLEPQMVKVHEEDGSWLLIETWLGLRWINLQGMRESVLLDVPAFNQRKLGYPTGCEIVSLGMMINYKVPANIETLVSKMPRSNNPYEGFRGNPANKNGFTIFPEALTALTAEYLGSAHNMTGTDTNGLKEKLNEGIPVITWVNGLGFNVHVICLTGYDENGFFYNDPWTGQKNAYLTYSAFYSIWDKPIYDRVLQTHYPARKALSYYSNF